MPDFRPSPEAAASSGELRVQFLEAIRRLPTGQRQVMLLLEGLAHGEIAEALGTNEGNEISTPVRDYFHGSTMGSAMPSRSRSISATSRSSLATSHARISWMSRSASRAASASLAKRERSWEVKGSGMLNVTVRKSRTPPHPPKAA
ncbi:MAG: hypothetical protein K2X03_22340 [Bryobacteraceae bacterium]|nr:hypothetical protein [Bryobacteraceae bacterium]